MEVINNVINEFIRQHREYTERTLAEIITKYDFVVGSKECKHRLMEVLPEGANIICSPYIESPTTIYAIKKFDTMDLITGLKFESEDKEPCDDYDASYCEQRDCVECEYNTGNN